MIGSGIGAALAAAGYAVAVAMAGKDGAGHGIEVSSRTGGTMLTVIVGLSLTSGAAWIVQTANRESARRDVHPVLIDAIEASSAVLAAAIADLVAERVVEKLNGMADQHHARTVASFREVITSELVAEELDAAVKRAHRYGMVAEARGRTDNVASIRRN